jgi:hypothetical protein
LPAATAFRISRIGHRLGVHFHGICRGRQRLLPREKLKRRSSEVRKLADAIAAINFHRCIHITKKLINMPELSDQELFSKIGLSDQKIKETVKNKVVSANLRTAILAVCYSIFSMYVITHSWL